MKILKKTALALLVLLLAMQFFRPEKNIDSSDHMALFMTETYPPKKVKEVLAHSCTDCHSDHTDYPWYNAVAPVSYWLAHHIDEGKEELNFSEWASYNRDKKAHKMEAVAEMIEKGEMPLKEYTWAHAKARLTDEQKKAVISWARSSKALYELGSLPK